MWCKSSDIISIMPKERLFNKRFGFERRATYLPPEGTFESALMVVKEVFPDQTLVCRTLHFGQSLKTKPQWIPGLLAFNIFWQVRVIGN